MTLSPRRLALALLHALLLVAVACGPAGGSVTGTATESGSSSTTNSSSESETAPTTTISICAERCVDDADCLVGGESGEDRWCGHGECALSHCTEDLECFIPLNRVSACGPGMPCAPLGLACVDLGDGLGSCVFPEGTPPCLSPPSTVVMLPEFDGGALVSVCVRDYACELATRSCFDHCSSDAECGDFVCDPLSQRCMCATDEACQSPAQATARCHEGVCGCGSDLDCITPMQPRCMADGACGCASDADCPFDRSRCRPDGGCGCASDAECVGSSDGDTCVDGYCTCGSSASCPAAVYDGTEVVCEAR